MRINEIKFSVGNDSRVACKVRHLVLDLRYTKKPKLDNSLTYRSGHLYLELTYDKLKDQMLNIHKTYPSEMHFVLLLAAGVDDLAKRKEYEKDYKMYRTASEILKSRSYLSTVENGVIEVIHCL